MQMDRIEAFRKRARRAVEVGYEGICSIYTYESTYSTEEHCERLIKVKVGEDIPCRLSYKGTSASNQTATVNEVGQEITLFLAPEVSCKPGSIVEVTQHGKANTFECAGINNLYYTHQEIKLKAVTQEA